MRFNYSYKRRPLLRSITYVSAATRGLMADEIQSLLRDARQFNASHGITGLLLFNGLEFFQLLEGTHEHLASALARIHAAAAHTEIRILHDGTLSQREFAGWDLAYIHCPGTQIESLTAANWTDLVASELHPEALSQGMQLARGYWADSLYGKA